MNAALHLTATVNRIACGYSVEWRPCGMNWTECPGTSDPPFLLSDAEKLSWRRQFWFFEELRTDEAALKIVDCMHRRGFTFSLIREPESSLWLGGFGMNGEGIVYAEGESVCQAICLGVIMARGNR